MIEFIYRSYHKYALFSDSNLILKTIISFRIFRKNKLNVFEFINSKFHRSQGINTLAEEILCAAISQNLKNILIFEHNFFNAYVIKIRTHNFKSNLFIVLKEYSVKLKIVRKSYFAHKNFIRKTLINF